MCRNLLNQRNIAFFSAIKSKEMAEIYEKLMKMDEISIPKNFK